MSNLTDWFQESVQPSMKDGWLTPGKRLEAVMQVWSKMVRSGEEWELSLPTATFFAPDLVTVGWAMHRFPNGNVIYLSPTLEMESLPEVMHTVAHELAHVALGHTKHEILAGQCAVKWEDRKHEKDADALAAKWGFPRRNKGWFLHKTIDTYIKDKGSRARRWIAQALGISLKEGTDEDGGASPAAIA
jgi:hypothetical protein